MPAKLRASLIATFAIPALLVVLLIAPQTLAAPARGQTATPASAALDEVLQSGVDRGLTGVTLYVERDGEVVFDGAAGLASVEGEIPLAPADRLRIYSITKVFTATLILQLVDEGVLSLDDTVADWLDDPEVQRIPNIERISLRQLLGHTSGVYDYFDADSPFWGTPTSARKPTGRGSGRRWS